MDRKQLFIGRSISARDATEDFPSTLQHHVAQAVLSLPFAHVSGVKAMPGIESLQQLHAQHVGAQVASLTSHLTSQMDKLKGSIGGALGANNDSTTKGESNFHSSKTTLKQPAAISPAIFSASSSSSKDVAKQSKAKPTVADTGPIVCIEFTRGKRRVYRSQKHNAADDDASTSGSNSFIVADDHVTHRKRMGNLIADYLLPQGFPDSVAPQYAKYMGWRGVQYFFGGAMSVFTTRSLLGAVGVANKHSGEAAAAINWVVKDGAGRMGRFLFARWGRELDCELKQFRLGGDILMEAGAALELSTALAPRLFLPLACTANLAKNLAAVAASSTRAPIYRTFARQNNLADVTAKGESVANLADVLGTVCGIMLARANFPVVPTFVGLSIGYLVASRREVDSVELPYLNRARLSYSARRFLHVGAVPKPDEANIKEPLLPWSDPNASRIVLGATVEEACSGPLELKTSLDAFKGKPYALTYRPETKKVYVLLREGAGTEAALQGALAAHCVLHIVNSAAGKDGGKLFQFNAESTSPLARNGGSIGKLHRHAVSLRGSDARKAGQEAVAYVAQNGGNVYSQFEDQAKAGGWKIGLTMLNPSETRVCPV